MEKNPSNIANVARVLFARYRSVSGDRVPESERFRTIVVVGAGASHAACGLPLGTTLAERIRSAVIREAHIPEQLIETERDRLSMVYRLERDDFETQLLALSKYAPNTVISVLRKQCGFAHYPSVTYEILAHLLKHGFLDAIINFNFDELLDQAIEEEVGAGRYVHIVRDGEWIRQLSADRDDGFRFDRPLYIKPHGTVSEPASLRFTRDAYFELPPDLADLLRALVQGESADSFVRRARSGELPRSSPEPPTRPACLLVIGHALQSFEFNTLLEHKACPHGTQLHVVTDNERELRNKLPAAMQYFLRERAIPIVKSEDGALDGVLLNLWRAIEAQVKECVDSGKPWMCARGIRRHELVAHLFQPHQRGDLYRRETGGLSEHERDALTTYFEDRLVIETALAIAKAKGFVDIREIDRGRVGRLYRKLSEVSVSSPRTLPGYLEELGMVRRDVFSESHWHDSMPASRGLQLTLDQGTYEAVTRARLIEDCARLLTTHRKRHFLGENGKSLMKKALDEMFSGDDVELSPERQISFKWKFKAARALRTLAELRRETYALLEGPGDLLVCVAESGAWLLREEFEAWTARRPVAAIVADPVFRQTLEDLRVTVRWLPWHLHNRHMTMQVVKEGECFRPTRGIYFERRYRSTELSPVVLEEAHDLVQARNDFTLYWLKAGRLEKGESDLITIRQPEIEDEWARIASQLYTGRV